MLEALADLIATLPGGPWLLAPLDVTRPHDLDWDTKWHGRVMTLSWAILLPMGVLIARFGKITPRQNWPQRLDNRLWFHTHWMMQTAATFGMVLGVYLIWKPAGEGWLIFVHRSLGWSIAAFCAMQVLAGMFRGSRGGPDHPAPDGSWRGDHFDMTLHRRAFEFMHKSIGYAALLCAMASIATGLWIANAPNWMWVTLSMWYAGLIVAFIALQRRGLCIDTYQAIWGPDPQLPGNRIRPIGWGIVRHAPPPGYRERPPSSSV